MSGGYAVWFWHFAEYGEKSSRVRRNDVAGVIKATRNILL
jgi:hypothetical protein